MIDRLLVCVIFVFPFLFISDDGLREDELPDLVRRMDSDDILNDIEEMSRRKAQGILTLLLS